MPTVVLHPGSLVFVTGVNGLIGSYVADQLLVRGYNVRGAVRDVDKCAWLGEYFAKQKYPGTFQLVGVSDMTVEGCYDGVVEDTDGFIHIASPMTGTDPSITIPTAIAGGLNALKAAAKCPTVKRFVATSSSMAVTFPKPNMDFEVNEDSWNEEAVQKGWKHPEGEPERMKGLYIYGALKTETERDMWRWVREERPGFGFSTVLPNVNFGKVLVPEHQGFPSTIAWGYAAFTGGEMFKAIAEAIKPQYFISLTDTALLHISALIHSDVHHERLFGFAQPYTFNDLLAIYRKLFPGKKFEEDIEGLGEDKMKVPNQRAEEVLGWVKKGGDGGQGWEGLESAVGGMCGGWGNEGEGVDGVVG
ncbi:NAD(P)-binding protein [Amniculicola lignicola CBS 123094]|uniref:NAD(P)-binding protein n=1 Tax=Amniculicola lignicola CBS 123094 TaxID=1392246 RepID=A0A6A5X2A7_9PLEO|nr:NAD(P)-binding protein [Amniculicola lignicola CBS 123094]